MGHSRASFEAPQGGGNRLLIGEKQSVVAVAVAVAVALTVHTRGDVGLTREGGRAGVSWKSGCILGKYWELPEREQTFVKIGMLW